MGTKITIELDDEEIAKIVEKLKNELKQASKTKCFV